MSQLVLKRGKFSRSSGEWEDDDYDVLADGVVVGRIFLSAKFPVGLPWMWTLIFGYHEDRTPTHGSESTREAAMSLISLNVRNRGQAGPHLLAVSFSQFDPQRS